MHSQTIDCCFPAVISVEPTYSYYEKVSEELERIVHEVKEQEELETLSDGEKLCFELLLSSCENSSIKRLLNCILIWIE